MFKELLENRQSIEPGKLQAKAFKQFPAVVEKSHFKHRRREDSIPDDRLYVVVGVASYSRNDLELLDDLELASPLWNGTDVSVFDFMECKSASDVSAFLPSLHTFVQTPVVAAWKNGKIVSAQAGLHGARELLLQLHVLPPNPCDSGDKPR